MIKLSLLHIQQCLGMKLTLCYVIKVMFFFLENN